MEAKVKVWMTVSGFAVILVAIALAPALQHAAWLKWTLYLIGAVLMSPLFVAIWGGEEEPVAETKPEIDPYSSTPLDLRLDNPYGPNGLLGHYADH
ncbi:hypothetical protein HGR00_08225 [Ralstonia insidiosa]|uniref:Uncharacterized protein n=1 Tax=Ralstonia insidiosa TaxID=190721 RepID=A0A848NY70_9RALS|nr:hypothetical protein [Ralstonia insidiosa]